MGELRQKFNEDMLLYGLAQNTRKSYTGVLLQASRHFWKSPDEITQDQWPKYFLMLIKEQNASPSKVALLLSAIKFLYRHTLDTVRLYLVEPNGQNAGLLRGGTRTDSATVRTADPETPLPILW